METAAVQMFGGFLGFIKVIALGVIGWTVKEIMMNKRDISDYKKEAAEIFASKDDVRDIKKDLKQDIREMKKELKQDFTRDTEEIKGTIRDIHNDIKTLLQR